MMQIKTRVTKTLQERWPERVVTSNYTDDNSRIWYRHIKVSVQGHGDKIAGLHYEFDKSEVMFHFEGDYAGASYLRLRRYVRKETSGINGLLWQDHCGHAKSCCKFDKQDIYNDETLIAQFGRLMSVMDPIINKALQTAPSVDSLLTHHEPKEDCHESVLLSESGDCRKDVRFVEGSLADIMAVNLKIPPYQRNYCWDDTNIEMLWKSLVVSDGEIHLGNIILQERNGADGVVEFDIIDGQQRLTTLSLFAMALGYRKPLPLLKESIKSAQAVRNIANAKYVIKNLYQHRETRIREMFEDKAGEQIRFGFLVLGPDTGLDLAYTFFNSQNSKGVPLSDYDLLKAHHLQYMIQDERACACASIWDKMISAPSSKKAENDKAGGDLIATLGKHLLRLRKWMRLKDIPTADHAVRDEFVAAPLIAAIPASGEEFNFYEKIQGGYHFFRYANIFVEQYQKFRHTDVVKVLDDILAFSSHSFYNDVIETLLFGYFLKFGTSYLAEAFFVISAIIADDRYSTGSMRRKKLMEHARNSRIIMMIDQAASPTFFLAEGINAIRINPLNLSDEEMQGKRHEFYSELRKGLKRIMPLLTEISIRNIITESYEV